MADIDVKWTIGLVASSTVLASVVTRILGKQERERNRKREQYAEALQTALSWREMLYRVRRRQSGKDYEEKLVDQFHHLQEKLDFYDGLIRTNSVSLSRSYRRLVKKIKDDTKPLINDAWAMKPVPAKNYDATKFKHPTFKKEINAFLEDTVRQVKPKYRIFSKIKLWWGNRDES